MESLASGPASTADFSNSDKNSMASPTDDKAATKVVIESTAKDDKAEIGVDTESTAKEDQARMGATIDTTAKEDTVPKLVIVTGSPEVDKSGPNDANTFDLTNAPTPNSTQSNTAFGTFDLTAHNWNISHFVTGTKMF